MQDLLVPDLDGDGGGGSAGHGGERVPEPDAVGGVQVDLSGGVVPVQDCPDRDRRVSVGVDRNEVDDRLSRAFTEMGLSESVTKRAVRGRD